MAVIVDFTSVADIVWYYTNVPDFNRVAVFQALSAPGMYSALATYVAFLNAGGLEYSAHYNQD